MITHFLMTEKQEKIISAALKLFAEEGFKSTSTSKVAKAAGVSEGLIFRHFSNKEGLLEAIMKLGEEQASLLLGNIVLEPNPKELLRKYINLILTVSKDKEAIDFWKLQFKIKWELEIYGEHKTKAIQEVLVNAFEKLEYDHPQEEANLLLTLMDGVATRFMLQKNYDIDNTIDFLKKKYDL